MTLQREWVISGGIDHRQKKETKGSGLHNQFIGITFSYQTASANGANAIVAGKHVSMKDYACLTCQATTELYFMYCLFL